MAGRLVVIKGYDKDKYLDLKTARSYCIGRGSSTREVDFKVDPGEYLTSRQHFFIDYRPPRFYVRDNNSTNGTLIIRGKDNIPVLNEEMELYDGDRIIAGNTVFRFDIIDGISSGKAEDSPNMAATYGSSPDTSASEAGQTPHYHQKPVSNRIDNISLAETPVQHLEPVSDLGQPSREFAFRSSALNAANPGNADDLQISMTDKEVPCFMVSPPSQYYSVTVPEIQLFHNTEVKCISCGMTISLGITLSELQANGYPVFLCKKCASGLIREHGLKDLEHYRILREISEDSLSLAYLAWHEESGMLAVIKAILSGLSGHRDDLQYLDREISVICGLKHPGIVKMYESVVHKDRVYLIYEYMPEGNLVSFMENTYGGPMPWQEACRVVFGMLSGLQYCHDMGITHGNIDTQTILFKKDMQGIPNARLGGFGLAEIYENTGLSMKNAGIREYSPFKAPELNINSRHIQPQADIFSIGIAMYYLLTCSFPYSSGQAQTDISKYSGRNSGMPALLKDRNPSFPSELYQIVYKAIQKQPEERFQTASEMAQALQQLTEGFSASSSR